MQKTQIKLFSELVSGFDSKPSEDEIKAALSNKWFAIQDRDTMDSYFMKLIPKTVGDYGFYQILADKYVSGVYFCKNKQLKCGISDDNKVWIMQDDLDVAMYISKVIINGKEKRLPKVGMIQGEMERDKLINAMKEKGFITEEEVKYFTRNWEERQELSKNHLKIHILETPPKR